MYRYSVAEKNINELLKDRYVLWLNINSNCGIIKNQSIINV
jgi:hypothetical protein